MATKLEEYMGRKPHPPKAATNDEIALPDFSKAGTPPPAQQAPATDYTKLFKDKGYYGAFQELYPKQDLTEDYNRTKRQQQMALLADIANVGSQLFASSRGARKFQPIQSKVPAYETQLQRLRDAQRAYDIDYANRSLAAAYKDYADKQAQDWRDKQLAAQREAAANKLAQDLMKFNANLTYKQAKDAADRELQEQQNEETKRHNEKMEELARQSAKQSWASENKAVDSAIGSDGSVYTRNSRLTENEAMQIAQYYLDDKELEKFAIVEKELVYNPDAKKIETVENKKIDWGAAAAKVLNSARMNAEELKSRGFKLGGGRTSTRSTGLGWGTEPTTDNETDW